MRKCLTALLLLSFTLALSSPTISAAGSTYPGSSLFSYQCTPQGIQFFTKDVKLFQVTFAQILGPLTLAMTSQQNQPIVIGNPASLWALKSNELQIHFTANPDETKLVWAATICPQLQPPPVLMLGQAIAFAKVTGVGQATAFAQITPTGQVIAYAQVIGSGQAYAYAQAAGNNVSPVSPNGHIHVVQPGETIYQISRLYSVPVGTLIALNGLTNPDMIRVGQVIRLP